MSPFRTDHPNYIPYETRLHLSRLHTFGERRTIAYIAFAIKCIQDHIHTQLTSHLNEYRRIAIHNLRPPKIFTYERRLNRRSPLFFIMQCIYKRFERNLRHNGYSRYCKGQIKKTFHKVQRNSHHDKLIQRGRKVTYTKKMPMSTTTTEKNCQCAANQKYKNIENHTSK